MISEQLLRARDLISRYEYEKVDGRRTIKARICSSVALGLEEREEYGSAANPETDSVAPSTPSGTSKNRGKGHGGAVVQAPDEDHKGKE